MGALIVIALAIGMFGLIKLFTSQTNGTDEQTVSAENKYVDAGIRLTHRLVKHLELQDWDNGLPVYTPEESRAISTALHEFQQQANRSAGGPVVFHPDAASLLQRMQTGRALRELADQGWRFSNKSTVPLDWKNRISTYLKAWASKLDPNTLIEAAEMLTVAGYKTEAKECYRAVLLFPGYAATFFGGTDRPEITARLMEQAQNALSSLS